jgi:hypothetical protein
VIKLQEIHSNRRRNVTVCDPKTHQVCLEYGRLPGQCKESIIVPIYKKGNKTDCNNYLGIPLLSTSYKILSNILLISLVGYIDEII